MSDLPHIYFLGDNIRSNELSSNYEYDNIPTFNENEFPILLTNNNDERTTGENISNQNEIEPNTHNFLGRTRNAENRKEESHDKYSFDNASGKMKYLIYKETFKFINKKIKVKYGNIGHGKNKKKLILAKHAQIANSKIDYNKEFLYKSLKEIFSVELSGRVKNYDKEHNQILIEKLINEDDMEKREYFKGLFNLTFLECLKYFRGEKNEKYVYIEGLKKFNDLVKENKFKKYEDAEDYINYLREFINDYENILDSRKGRRSPIINDEVI